jgi:hypothetical protein
MAFNVKQISSLIKLTSDTDVHELKEINRKKVLKGERFNYQLAMQSIEERKKVKVWVESDLGDCVKLYFVKNIVVDLPNTNKITNENYLLEKPGFLPDLLVPAKEQDNKTIVNEVNQSIWVKVDVPKDIPAGKYTVTINVGTDKLATFGTSYPDVVSCTMEIEVADEQMPPQKLIYTRWFYLDCIADIHRVDIFSEEHWHLIEEYIAAAADVGINMLLVPVHTPPLDTEVGTFRPCVQLVDIEKVGDMYRFGFEKFHRYISLCKKHGIKYYEIAHMFSQWGAKCTPNIMVTENGKKEYMFSWDMAADDPRYVAFLKQYIAAISEELVKEGIADNTYFHISDEPNLDNTEKYTTAKNIIKPLIGNSKSFDAISHVEFAETGLVECPVTAVGNIHEFLEHHFENQWVYYCCGPEKLYTNSFIAMPSARTRILGFLVYKYDIKGFLHWGFNFYNAVKSAYHINPYLTTSADGRFASGDPFIVYPGNDTAYPSIRGEVTYEAVQDIDVCVALEKKIGREAVVELIDKAAGRDLRFDDYPCDIDFLEGLRAQMIDML